MPGRLISAGSAAVLGAIAEAHARAGGTALLPRALAHAAWPVRAGALRGAIALRTPETIDLLVARLDQEDGRLRDDLAFALRSLTGREDGWGAWWPAAREGFVVPAAPAVDAEQERANPTGVAGDGPTAFLGIRTASRRVILVLDGAPGPWDAVKEQAAACLATLPENGTFDLVIADDAPKAWRKKMAAAIPSNRKAALDALAKYEPKSGADLQAALAAALDVADQGRAEAAADTIFLLSVRGPTAGMFEDGFQVAQETNGRNRVMGLRIHAVGRSTGAESYWLQDLVRPFGGVWHDLG